MFFTTSDLVNRMNATLRADADNGVGGVGGVGGGFELQRRFPDGRTRRADEADTAAADFQSKLKQAAHATSGLKNAEKLEWAKLQRAEGNRLFAAAEYNEAMDVYLTCLVAADQSGPKKTATTEAADDGDDDAVAKARAEREVQLPVLLNLAACTLRLRMLSKTVEFCDLAASLPTRCGDASPKVYFRRGKARALMGEYAAAERDLERASTLLDDDVDGVKEREAVRRELDKLRRLRNTARTNRARQKKAMRSLLGDGGSVRDERERDADRDKDNDDGTVDGSKNGAKQTRPPSRGDHIVVKGLYQDDEKTRRSFSKLRSTSKRYKIAGELAVQPSEQSKEDRTANLVLLSISLVLLISCLRFY